jgi:DNA primase
MFLVNGAPLLEDDLSVLQELRRQLAVSGVFRFADFKVGAKNIQFNCPIHNNGQERKPSCGIRTQSDKNARAGTVHCFACGYTATLEQMIGHCFGVDDSGQFGTRWLTKNFRMIEVENRPEIELDLLRQRDESTTRFISENELESYRFTHSYAYERKMTDEIIEKFDVGFGDFVLEDRLKQKHRYKCLTFPVRDVDGRTLFIARRSVSAKFFHIPEDVNKPVYGLYELPSDATEVIICESIFNALTCYVYGKPAVALLGLGTSYQYDQLLRLSARKYVLGFDGDAAGRRAVERFKKAIGNKKLITVLDIPEGKDINDLSKEEFDALQQWC